MKQSVRLAVASNDGIAINQHFGHAREFWIYTATLPHCTLLEKRVVEHYCHGHHGSQSAMQKILVTIGDCDAVFCAMIGDGPREKLEAIGLQSVVDYAYAAIEPSLLDYAHSVLIDEPRN